MTLRSPSATSLVTYGIQICEGEGCEVEGCEGEGWEVVGGGGELDWPVSLVTSSSRMPRSPSFNLFLAISARA